MCIQCGKHYYRVHAVVFTGPGEGHERAARQLSEPVKAVASEAGVQLIELAGDAVAAAAEAAED